MRYWTWKEIREKVERDLGLEQEEFVDLDELLGYANEAIDEAEAEIHTIYEDYFLKKANINLVAGQDLYDLPTDIYANKIRNVIYAKTSTDYYLCPRIKHKDMFIDIYETETNDTNAEYRYLLLNESATNGVQLKLVPPARDNITNGLTVWYIRNANRLEDDTDVCDIPEFVSFVIQYIKMRIWEKEGNPNFQSGLNMLNNQRQQMVSTLTNMIIDGDTEIEKDLTFYRDMV